MSPPTRTSAAVPADLAAEVRAAVERAKASGRTQFLAWAFALPALAAEDGLRAYAWAGNRDRSYWERVDAGELFFAWGSVDELEDDGAGRVAAVRDWQRDLVARLRFAGEARPGGGPLLLGGFAFEAKTNADPDWKNFPAARFRLPEGLLERLDGRGRAVVFARVEPTTSAAAVEADLARRIGEAFAAIAPRAEAAAHAQTSAVGGESSAVRDEAAATARREGPEYRVRSDRGHARFRAQVESALAEIASGRLAKLVLARSLAVEHDGDFDVAGFLARLRSTYPSCTLVAVGRGRDTFLAATPETLVRVAGRRVATAALAGSTPRGRKPEEDRALADALLASPKERAEHAHVVDAIRGVLAPRCARLEIAAGPRLRALFGIQHLETAIEGELAAARPGAPPDDVLSLVEALHPTPAVAGAPTVAAAAWLRRHEELERGWYAAPIGWLDAEGGGAFCVGLRSALIRNGLAPVGQSGASRARLYAGAGIVAGSDPEQELVETRIKLRALLAPLTEI
jgi:isochorismate synthase